MKTLVLVVASLLLILGGWFWYSQGDFGWLGAGFSRAEVTVTGHVADVDQSEIMVDGPFRLKIFTEAGEEYIVVVPSMGINLCAAAENMADTANIAVGDTVVVTARVDSEGNLIPCDKKNDRLEVTGRMLDTTYGYQFAYRKGPNGYINLEDNDSESSEYVTGVRLYNETDYEAVTESGEATELPPAISLRIYQNNEKLQPSVWAMRHKSELNYGQMLGSEEEVVVGGANADKFTVDGLYTTEVYVVASGQRVYVLSGDYLDKNSDIYRDFLDVVASFQFIQPGSVGAGAKIDTRVACESALAYMTFASGEEADAFVEECVQGEHPEVIDRYIESMGFDGASI